MKKIKVFVSYPFEERDFAQLICDELEDENFEVWFDKRELEESCDSVELNAHPDTKILYGLRNADVIVLVITEPMLDVILDYRVGELGLKSTSNFERYGIDRFYSLREEWPIVIAEKLIELTWNRDKRAEEAKRCHTVVCPIFYKVGKVKRDWLKQLYLKVLFEYAMDRSYNRASTLLQGELVKLNWGYRNYNRMKFECDDPSESSDLSIFLKEAMENDIAFKGIKSKVQTESVE